jgi:hypothetical protein
MPGTGIRILSFSIPSYTCTPFCTMINIIFGYQLQLVRELLILLPH